MPSETHDHGRVAADDRADTEAPLRPSHLWVAALVALAAAASLGGYEFIRSASNTLFKQAYGQHNLPVIMAVMPLGVLAALYVYGRMLSRLGPRRTLLWTTLLSALAIAGCTLAVRAGHDLATAALFIVRETYVVMLIEQYWSLINSTLGEPQARRLNGPITGVASLGAIGGGLLLHRFAQTLGTSVMPLFAAAALIPAALLGDWAYRRAGEPRPTPREAAQRENALGLRQFVRTPMLVFLLLVILATQVVSTMLDLRFQGALTLRFGDTDEQTAFSGWFFSMLNIAAAVLQFVVTPLLLRVLPLAAVHIAIPCVHIFAAGYLLGSPSLAAAGTAYLLFKSLDYSLFRAAKEILYIPLSFDARYRAKEVIDVFGYRFAKGGISAGVAVATRLTTVTQSAYALGAAVAGGVWLLLVIPMLRRRKPMSAYNPRP